MRSPGLGAALTLIMHGASARPCVTTWVFCCRREPCVLLRDEASLCSEFQCYGLPSSMFFFLASLNSEAIRIIRSNVAPCPLQCGGTLALVEGALRLRLFMIPVMSFRHERYLQCDNCKFVKPWNPSNSKGDSA
jgi:hypothetical protein